MAVMVVNCYLKFEFSFIRLFKCYRLMFQFHLFKLNYFLITLFRGLKFKLFMREQTNFLKLQLEHFGIKHIFHLFHKSFNTITTIILMFHLLIYINISIEI